MRACVFDKFGEPSEVLGVRDVADPKPDHGEILVRMLASPVNPSDLMTIRGQYGKLPALPATPGYEGVGVVESSGGGLLANYMVGKRVAVLNGVTGNWCERTVVLAKQAIPLAKDLPVEQAAMFFVNPATAFIMTRLVLNVPRDAWLLQTAAGSALGRMVIRLGERFGFRTLNVVRREDQADELRSAGVANAIAFEPGRHEPAKFRETILAATGGQGPEFAIDPVGGETGSLVASCLALNGRMLIFGSLSGEPLVVHPRSLITPTASISGFWLARWMPAQSLLQKLKLVKQVTRLMREGILVADVSHIFLLDQIRDAVTAAESRARGGKVLVQMAEE